MIKKVVATFPLYLAYAGNVLAQTTNTVTDTTSKGGTSSSLPNAGSTQITYVIFVFGVLLFVFGTLRLIQSFREENS